MSGPTFSKSARDILDHAADDARRRGHEYIGTEHILTAVIQHPNESIARIFTANAIDSKALLDQLDGIVRPGKSTGSSGTLPFTSRARMVLELAIDEARSLGRTDAGAEFLLAGLLDERRGVGAQVLARGGLTMDAVRIAITQGSTS